MTLRLTREEVEWLIAVLERERSVCALLANQRLRPAKLETYRRDQDVATGMLARLKGETP